MVTVEATGKACRSCSELQPLSEFYRNPETKDRHQATCKRCVCDRQKAKRKPELPTDRHRLRKRSRRVSRGVGRPYVLGVWRFDGDRVCMARCNCRATVALLVLKLGELPIPLRLCERHYRIAIGSVDFDTI